MLMNHPNPREAMFKMWKKTRYLVAQEPAASDYSETKPGYYKGRVVIPGPQANPKLSATMEFGSANVRDFEQMMNRHHIRFVDNMTTDNADESVKRALFTVMDASEANDYEAKLKEYYANNKPQRVSSKAT